jgi:predicted dehydrogenase
MPDKVRVGIAGTSWWADYMFAPSIRSHPQAELAAVCGRNRGNANEIAAKFNIPQVYTDYREMFGQGNLDAVVVATPDDTHYTITMQALKAGLHVLCEKPMASTAQQAREMYETAEAAKVRHMLFFTYRWMPYFRYARDLVEQGAIGRCYHCEFHYLGGYARGENYMWRFDQDRANGVLGDLGSHTIDLARWLVGDIDRVSAGLSVSVRRLGKDGGPINPANDSARLLVEFANGAYGVIQASAVAHTANRDQQQHIRLFGEAGTLDINVNYGGPEPWATIQAARSSEATLQTLAVPESYWGDVSRTDPFEVFTKQSAGARQFLDAILEDRPISPSFYDGYKAQQVIDAALESDRTGQAVAIAG